MDENTQIDAPLQSDQKEEEKKVDPADNLTPEHPRFKQVIEKNHALEGQLSTVKQELEDLKAKIAERQDRTGDDELTEDERLAMAKINKQLEGRYVTKEQLDEERRVTTRAAKLERLSGVYDGSNGYPKFVSKDVTMYAEANGYGDNVEAAYYDMHRQAIINTEAKRLAKAPEPGRSEQPTGGERQIPNTELTPEQIANMSDSEYEKHREKILAGIKQGR